MAKKKLDGVETATVVLNLENVLIFFAVAIILGIYLSAKLSDDPPENIPTQTIELTPSSVPTASVVE